MLILLDIDGVMVSAKSWSPPPFLEDGFYMFNSKSVNALNDIISKTDASILLTTSHKDRFSVDEWIQIFNNRGIVAKGLRKLPDNTDNLNRREEIINWFSIDKDVQDFVIIDDDKSLNSLPELLKERLVQTRPLVGLTQSDVHNSISILNTPLEYA